MISRNTLRNLRVSDYAIQIKGLPRDAGVTIQEVKRHFKKFGKIIEVYLGRRYEDLLFFYSKRAILKKEICNREALLKFSGKDPNKDTKLKLLKLAILKFDERIETEKSVRKHNELPIKRGYIIFNSKKDKIHCIKAYKPRWCACCRKKNKDLLFRGTNSLTINQAPDPSDIIWENLEIGK